MPNSMSLVRPIALAAVLAGAALSLPVQAQTIFKQVLPDGSVIYTDKPVANAHTEKRIPVEAPPPVMRQLPMAPREPFQVGVPGTPIGAGTMPPLPGSTVQQAPAPTPALPQPPRDPVAEARRAATAAAAAEAAQTAAARASELAQARTDLDRAIAAQQRGQEPAEGERSASTGGGSRLNERYQERQDQLADAVRQAQARLEELQKSQR